MPRTITPTAAAQAALQCGSSPRIILRVDFGGAIGTKFYCDEAITSPVAAEGRLLNAVEVDMRLSEKGLQAVSDISITLDDTDGVLRGYAQSTPIELKRAWVYQHFTGGSVDDLVPLLVGQIDSPVTWDESENSLGFDVTDIITGYDVTIGNVIEREDFPATPDGNDGATLPIVFGRVEKLKAVQMNCGLVGTLMHDVYNSVGAGEALNIDGGEDFPQDEEINIRIAEEIISGTMSGNIFTISERTPIYTVIFSGATVRYHTGNLVYIVNDARSLAVHKVRAQRNFKIKSGSTGTREVQQMIDVPSTAYTVNLNDTTTFPELGRAVTTITMEMPLSDRDGENWSDDNIYVDLSGYTPDGSTLIENPADVIKYLFTDFGDLPTANIDADSFAAANTSLADRPFAFVIREQKDLRDLTADLAFQAQCQILVISAKIYLFVLSDATGTSQMELADGISDEPVSLSWQAVEDIWTEVTTKYAPDLSGLETRKERRFKLKDSTAEDAFKRRAEDLDLWAYRSTASAKAVSQYYLNRHCRAWQKVTLSTYLDTLELLPLDWVDVGGLEYFSTGQTARVDSTRIIPGSAEPASADRIEFDLFLPIYPGCASACEVACEAGGCEGSAEHGGGGGVTCLTTCETTCQTACQLVCVTTCEAACQAACQTGCQTQSEVPEPDYEFELTAPTYVERGVAFNITIQSKKIADDTDETDYIPDGNVALSALHSDDELTPVYTDSTGWTNGAKTVSLTLSGGTEPKEVTLRVADDEGRVGECTVTVAASGDFGFEMTAPDTIEWGKEFTLALKSVHLHDGNDDTGYTPSDHVNLGTDIERITPTTTDSSSWTSGAKDVTCRMIGSGTKNIILLAADPDSDRTGHTTIQMFEGNYGFSVTAPTNVERGVAFNITIQSILLADSSADTTYTPDGNVEISDDSSTDAVAPTYTDNTGWSSGAKTVSVTLSGGSGGGSVTLTVLDPATGRSGTATVTVGGSTDMGFKLTPPSSVARYQNFSLTVQSINMSTGADDTSYTPEGNINLTDSAGVLLPATIDNTGWSSGAKTITDARIFGESASTDTITAADPNSSRTGAANITITENEYSFALTAPETVSRGVDFELTINSQTAAGADDTSYTPTGNVILFIDDEDETLSPSYTDNTGWSSGAKTVTCNITGELTDKTIIIYAYDSDTGRIGSAQFSLATLFALELDAPESALPGSDFAVSIQSIEMPGGTDDTTYTPQSTITFTDDSDDYDIAPETVNDIGWQSGLKNVTARFVGDSDIKTVRITATDDSDGRTGYADITVGYMYGFILSAPVTADRGTEFDITIRSVNLQTGADDTSYTPAGDVTIEAESNTGDTISPAYTSSSSWADGAKTVTCVLQNGSDSGSARITVTDPNTGRTGYADIIIGTASILSANSYSRRLTKTYSDSDTGSPYTQTDINTIFAATQAEIPTTATPYYPPTAEMYLADWSNSGGGSYGRIKRIALVFDTSSLAEGTPCYLKTSSADSDQSKVYFRENLGSYNYRFCQVHETLNNGLYIAKGAWSGDYAVYDDWSAYSSTVFFPFNRLAYSKPVPDETDDSSSFSSTLGSRLLRVPNSYINYGGLTKLMVMLNESPNPWKITDSVGSASSTESPEISFTSYFGIDGLVVG